MKFDYLARTQKGEIQAGTVEASNRAVALKTLQSHNLIVTRLWTSERTSLFTKKFTFLNRVKRKEVFVFFRQLAILVDADVPLVQSLKVLSEQLRSAYFKKIIFKVARDIDGGMSFSKAMEKHPAVFSALCINLIKIGEVSGRLQESLGYLADYLEREYYLISRIRGAMIYPLFILGAFVVVAILIMVMVIPSLTSILTETGQMLPLSTRIVIWTSEWIRSWFWLVILLLIIVTPFFIRYKRTDKGRVVIDKLKLKIPVLGFVIREIYLSRFADNLSVLIKGGVSIIQSLNVAGQVVGNAIFQQIIFQARDEVKAGKNISATLEEHKEFTPLFCQMVRTGETTGRLDSILEKLSKFYDKEVENIVNNLNQLIEPVLIVALGIGVAILIFAVFMPIYNMVGSF